jgi:hypothetical protein
MSIVVGVVVIRVRIDSICRLLLQIFPASSTRFATWDMRSLFEDLVDPSGQVGPCVTYPIIKLRRVARTVELSWDTFSQDLRGVCRSLKAVFVSSCLLSILILFSSDYLASNEIPCLNSITLLSPM